MVAPKIESYRFGQIVIDGQSYDQDVIILPDGVRGGWWRREGHVLHVEDLDAVFEAGPEVLVVGQGANGRMRVTRGTEQALRDAGIEVVILNSHDAVDRYNELRGEREVAAALHLTC